MTFNQPNHALFLTKEEYKELHHKMADGMMIMKRIQDHYNVRIDIDFAYEPDGSIEQEIKGGTDPDSFIDKLYDTGFNIYIEHDHFDYGSFDPIHCTTVMEGLKYLAGKLRPVDTIVQHVVDECRGVYSPQYFCQVYGDQIQGVPENVIDAVLAGPDQDHYDSNWELIMDEGYVVDEDRWSWNIHQDGSIYLIDMHLSSLEQELLPVYQ